jgi:hypothetical protein
MIRGGMDRLSRIIATALAAMPFMLSAARADTNSGITVSGGLEYSSNPYLLNANAASVARGRVSVSPFVEERTARSTLRVATDASFSKFSRQYRDAVDLTAQVGYDNRVTSQLSVRAGIALTSSIGGQYNSVPVFGAIPPGQTVPPIIDITVVGLQDRTTQAQASAGLTYNIDTKNSISLGYDGTILRYPSAVNRDEYSSVGQNVSYSRVINSRVTMGASVGVTRVNYFGTRVGDAVIISPSINGNLRLSQQWTLSAGVGVSNSRVNLFTGRLSSTNFSGNLNACRTDSRSNFCLNAGRSSGASSFDGVRVTTTAGASMNYQLSARDTISASGGYSRSTAPRTIFGGATYDYLSGQTSLARKFSDRLTGTVTGGFTQANLQGRRSNAFASIGISYSFGRR